MATNLEDLKVAVNQYNKARIVFAKKATKLVTAKSDYDAAMADVTVKHDALNLCIDQLNQAGDTAVTAETALIVGP